MKRSRFSEEQIIATLKEQEAGAKTADVCRKYGVSGAGGEEAASSSPATSRQENCTELIMFCAPFWLTPKPYRERSDASALPL